MSCSSASTAAARTTVAPLATATEVIGRGEAGPSNMQAVGVTRAFKAIEDAVAAAFAEAGRPPATVRAAVLGLAGADRQQEQTMVRSWAERVGLARKSTSSMTHNCCSRPARRKGGA